MPSLGADMEAATLVEWLVKPGASLRRGDVLAVVETQKGAIEIEFFDEGVFQAPLVDLGAKVPVGAPIALIRRHDEVPAPSGEEIAVASQTGAQPARAVAAGAEDQKPPPAKPELLAELVLPPVTPVVTAEPQATRLRVSPVARRYAGEHGIDLDTIKGTGPGDAIQLKDVTVAKAHPNAPTRSPPDVQQAAPSGMRAAIAAAMARAKREIPHYYLAHVVDLTAADAWLSSFNTTRAPEERLALGVLFVKSVARAVRKYPEFNGHFVDGSFRQSAAVHLGLAINIRGTGLVAPAIHDADALGVPELMVAMRDLVGRVRAGRFRSSELTDATMTVSSLGDRGVESLYGVIYPPQVAIVGFGTPVTEVRVVDGLIGPRRVVHCTLAADHRVSDGHRGALFLAHIAHLLQKPEAL
nr:2-oxo acid dehydrogenase subunit E2 [Rhizobium sp. TCK]